MRRHIYQKMGESTKERNYVLVDLDIPSCYTTILLGLYNKELKILERVIKVIKGGLWNYIEKEFIREKQKFHKSAVKICVYSSEFGGGHDGRDH